VQHYIENTVIVYVVHRRSFCFCNAKGYCAIVDQQRTTTMHWWSSMGEHKSKPLKLLIVPVVADPLVLYRARQDQENIGCQQLRVSQGSQAHAHDHQTQVARDISVYAFPMLKKDFRWVTTFFYTLLSFFSSIL
jgi:hypothetical protein